MPTFHMITGALFKGSTFGPIEIGVPPEEASTDGIGKNGEVARHGVIMPTQVHTLGVSQVSRHGVIMLNPNYVGSIRAVQHVFSYEAFGANDYTVEGVDGTMSTRVIFTKFLENIIDIEYRLNQGAWQSTGVSALPATMVIPNSKYLNISFRVKDASGYSDADIGKSVPFLTFKQSFYTGLTLSEMTFGSFTPTAGKTYVIAFGQVPFSSYTSYGSMTIGAVGRAKGTGTPLPDLSGALSSGGANIQLGRKGGIGIWTAPDATPVALYVDSTGYPDNNACFFYEVADGYSGSGNGAFAQRPAVGNQKINAIVNPTAADSIVVSALFRVGSNPVDPLIESSLGYQSQDYNNNGIGCSMYTNYAGNTDPLENWVDHPLLKTGSVLLSAEIKKAI